MIKKSLWSWLPIAVSGTLILLVVYIVLQQNYRQAANDPQIELVQNASIALSQGFPIQALFANATQLDINKTLSMFVMAFDESGAIISASVTNGSSTVPVPPKGVFDYVRSHGEHRITWETSSGLRFAAVVDKFKSAKSSGYIMAARSLAEVEAREANLSWVIFIGWLIFMIVSFASVVVADMMKPLNEGDGEIII